MSIQPFKTLVTCAICGKYITSDESLIAPHLAMAWNENFRLPDGRNSSPGRMIVCSDCFSKNQFDRAKGRYQNGRKKSKGKHHG